MKLSSIQANPFRDLTRNPLDPDKVTALRASIRSTGFWDNVVARKVGGNGKVELAYGHNRIEAARQELGKSAEVGIILKDLSDADMIRVMAAENKEEWNHSSMAQQESVRAVVEAYGAGKIELDQPGVQATKQELRFAPSLVRGYVQVSTPAHPYTAKTVATFLGADWSSETVASILTQLEAMEKGSLPESVFQGVRPEYAANIVTASNIAEREALRAGMSEPEARTVAKEVAQEIADQVRAGKATRHGSAVSTAISDVRAKAIADRLPQQPAPRRPAPPPYRVAQQLHDYLKGVFTRLYTGAGTYGDLLEVVIENAGSPAFKPDGPKGVQLDAQIAQRLRELAAQAIEYADRIDGSRKEIS